MERGLRNLRDASAGSLTGRVVYIVKTHQRLLQGTFWKTPGLDGSGSDLPGDVPINTPDTCSSLWEGPLTKTGSPMHGLTGRPCGQNAQFHG